MLAIALGNQAYITRQLGIAPRRQVGEQVMLDLVAEVAGEDMQQRPAGQVAGTAQLTQVPVSTGLPLQYFGCKYRRLLGEVTAEDHQKGPQVAQQIGHQVAGQYGQRIGAEQQRQQRKRQIVLAPLPRLGRGSPHKETT